MPLLKQSPDIVQSCIPRPSLLSETVSFTAASQWTWGLKFSLNQSHMHSPEAVNTHLEHHKGIDVQLKLVPNKFTIYSCLSSSL